MHPWIALVLAGLCEIGWPLGFKLAHAFSKYHYLCIAFAVICMGVSGFLLFVAQKHIPMGTAYAVWTGIGAAGAFITGVLLFGDVLSWGRVLGVSLIIAGVIVLKTLST